MSDSENAKSWGTSVMKPSIKSTHRALFLALQADTKEFPGGISGVAKLLGVNGNTLSNGLNPDHPTAPPPFSTIVEIITLTQARRAVFSLAQLVNQVPMDFEIEDRSPNEAIALFLSLVTSASNALGVGSEAAKDGRFDPCERKEIEPLLLALMKASSELLHAIRGAGV